jgi:hypothetical protein
MMRVLRISDIIARWMAFKLHTVWTENRDKQREGRGHRGEGRGREKEFQLNPSAASFELRQLEVLFLRPIL